VRPVGICMLMGCEVNSIGHSDRIQLIPLEQYRDDEQLSDTSLE
jgi:hypothetical protein